MQRIVNGYVIGPDATLSRANLAGADLSGANLARADMYLADLYRANLAGACLYRAVLEDANLKGANLEGANLKGANLEGANLEGANLEGANLEGAVLNGAKLGGAKMPAIDHVPAEGEFLAYKKVWVVRRANESWARDAIQDVVIELRIPAAAARTGSWVGRKCRASEAVPTGRYWNPTSDDGEGPWVERFAGRGLLLGESIHVYANRQGTFEYRAAEPARAPKYDPDPSVECAHGIHFFMTLEEAQQYTY